MHARFATWDNEEKRSHANTQVASCYGDAPGLSMSNFVVQLPNVHCNSPLCSYHVAHSGGVVESFVQLLY